MKKAVLVAALLAAGGLAVRSLLADAPQPGAAAADTEASPKVALPPKPILRPIVRRQQPPPRVAPQPSSGAHATSGQAPSSAAPANEDLVDANAEEKRQLAEVLTWADQATESIRAHGRNGDLTAEEAEIALLKVRRDELKMRAQVLGEDRAAIVRDLEMEDVEKMAQTDEFRGRAAEAREEGQRRRSDAGAPSK